MVIILALFRDGLTRSGLFCAISYMVERLKVEQDVDVFQSVKHIRMNRPKLIPNLVSSTTIFLILRSRLFCWVT
jgi:hypothetical protein